MNKLLFATLLLSTSFAQANHLPAAASLVTAGALQIFHADCSVASDPETQVGNGMVPGVVIIALPEDLDLTADEEALTQ